MGCTYITLTNSGSSANLVGALALAEKCRKAGKPLTAFASAFTFPTTISSLLLAGFKIHLIDVEKGGFNMDLNILENIPNPASVIA
ncbi:MAG: DegT/DnrJ/EryC1/StrS family aminotransferase, partial [Muribaculaceae bacterium]|nr:DegT/DnrJ/EryC1/StrS family aminotransferase [Muribaculaceae bacterium]